MPIDQIARAREAWPLMVARVQSGDDPYTYGGLTDRMGLHHRAADHFLAVIQNYCAAHGLPNLAAFAVSATTGLPGRGYARNRDRDSFDRELARVRRHVWPAAAPF